MRTWSIFSLLLSITVTNVYGAPSICRKRSEGQGGTSEVDYQQPLIDVAKGNEAFRKTMSTSYPGLLEELTTKGQHPPFAYLGCSDSRVPETLVFGGKPGDFFTMRNIANLYQKADTSAEAFVGYAVTALGVKHIVVMGHYGCGGVAGAIVEGSKKLNAPKTLITVADAAVKAHIDPIVELFLTSDNPKVVELRERYKAASEVKAPEITDEGFRALIEENVKRSAHAIATNAVLNNREVELQTQNSNGSHEGGSSGHEAKPIPVYVHSWVYDIKTGEVKDLDYSFGPDGNQIPMLKHAQGS